MFGAAVDDAENLLTPFVVALIALPPLPSVAVIGALLTGVVAQFGWRGLSRCGVLYGGGWCAGALASPHIVYQPSRFVDALCLAFIVAYTTPLCALGYEETMRMYRMRERFASSPANSSCSATVCRAMSPRPLRRVRRRHLSSGAGSRWHSSTFRISPR